MYLLNFIHLFIQISIFLNNWVGLRARGGIAEGIGAGWGLSSFSLFNGYVLTTRLSFLQLQGTNLISNSFMTVFSAWDQFLCTSLRQTSQLGSTPRSMWSPDPFSLPPTFLLSAISTSTSLLFSPSSTWWVLNRAPSLPRADCLEKQNQTKISRKMAVYIKCLIGTHSEPSLVIMYEPVGPVS